MEIRRVEGVYLQKISEEFQPILTERLSESLRIKLLSSVEEVLPSLFEHSKTAKGFVLSVEGSKAQILLQKGVSLEVENLSGVPLKEGQIIYLERTESPNLLRLVAVESPVNEEKLLVDMFEGKDGFELNLDLESFVRNSGLFYENKLLKFLQGKISIEELAKDAKYLLLKDIQDQFPELKDFEGYSLLDKLSTYVNLLKTIREWKDSLDYLLLERLSHEEFARLIKYLSENKQSTLVTLIEKQDRARVLLELYKAVNEDVNFPYRDNFIQAFEKLKGSLIYEGLKEGDPIKVEKGIEELQKFASMLDKEQKAQELMQKLYLINHLQYTMAFRDRLYLPVRYRDGRGGLMYYPSDSYRVFIHLNYEDYYISALLVAPKSKEVKKLSLRFFTDSQDIHQRITEGRTILEAYLKEEGLELGSFDVILQDKRATMESFIQEMNVSNFYRVV
ncbi:hypothetical protein [Thermocrinis minervae]|uniref:Uncharacterized protein n=1 Tax=Thermocrinis minervae TaxID=381751 RepID=A0A1M6SU18_9AQUI|nr:hypothetical protein [Thermocrinis minervae]SHK48156.1 hypothetical protein SAMN05444391_1165 [Thermocrinis minervae]